jgi:hypothetical protein
MRWMALLAGVAALCAAGAARAADVPDAALKRLNDCQAVKDVAERAACYDAAVAALNTAVRSGEVVIVEKKQAEKARREAFGFNLPSLSIFDRVTGGGDAKAEGGAREAASRPLDSITSQVKSASRDALDKWVVELADGAVWRQIDNEPISPAPRAGATVEIRRASMGSYFMKVGAARGVRARRSE